MQNHAAYRLTHVRRRRGRQQWSTFDDERYDVTLQMGATVGFLGVTFLCPCGERETIDYFFHLTDGDHVYSNCMRPVVDTDDPSRIKLVLPSREWGVFQLAKKHSDFDDAYVHSLVVCANERRPRENTVRRFFETVHARIVLKRRIKGAFDRLYFRCFRKTFAPGRPSAERAKAEYNIAFL